MNTRAKQREIREQHAKLRQLRGGGEPNPPERAKRLSLSEIVRLLLQRGGGDRSSVTLKESAKGDTQPEVVVRTGDEVATVQEAAALAVQVYDELRAKYPRAENGGAA